MEANIALTGISCRYPESGSTAEFYENLMKGSNLVTADDRRFGKIPDIASFDATFFGVHGKQASKMDPQLRLLLETSFEAISDAGLSPEQLRGSRTGVYVGSCFTDAHELFFEQEITGYENTGCAQSMFANRLSFFYDLRGPSMNIDTACSSGLVALCQALTDLRTGIIDRALVGGSSVLLSPHKSKAFEKLKMLSPTGSCKSFDTAADGYARSEGVAVVLLSRVDALDSAYLHILGEGVNSDGFTERGITFPNVHAQIQLCRDIFERFQYVEAHGTGTVAGDGEELQALSTSYCCQQRSAASPLYVGSVKSNMGHCEGGSGIAGLIKLSLASRYGQLPGNLHFHNPNPKLRELAGTCQVVVQPLAMSVGDICGLSSFGFGGTNAHVVVKMGNKRRTPDIPEPSVNADESWMTVTPCFGRTEEAVTRMLESGLTSQVPVGPALLKTGDLSPYPFRGVRVSGKASVAQVGPKAPPVYLVFGGNGSQWASMGKSLYESSAVFHQTIDRCIAAGKALGVDLSQVLICNPDPSHVFTAAHGDMGLAAMQIGLIEMVRVSGIKWDGVIGHSAGETACGYADGCTTLEQTLQIAHARSTCVLGFPSIAGQGMMIAVGLSKEDAQALIAPLDGVVVACHNSPDGVTISGRREVVAELLEQLKARGVFARAVETRGMAFHSPMLQPALPSLLARLKEILPEPRARSAGWISTCFLEETSISGHVSPEYHVHNFSNPVEFCTALTRIPAGAVLLELSPHAIMANPARRTRTDVGYVGFMKMGEPGAATVQRALAEAWKLGVPLASPPVCVGPRLLGWDHSAELPLPRFGASKSRGITVKYDISNSTYLLHHKIDGRPLMPAASYLYSAWTAFAEQRGLLPETCPVRLSDISINQAVQIDEASTVTFEVTFGAGPKYHFELCRGEEKVVNGVIEVIDAFELPALRPVEADKLLSQGELYSRLARSGYEYGPDFQGVARALPDATAALLANPVLTGGRAWIPFIDSLLHLAVLGQADGTLRVPVSFREVDFSGRPLDSEVLANRRASGDLLSAQVIIRGMATDALVRKTGDPTLNQVRTAVHWMPYGTRALESPEHEAYSRVLQEQLARLRSRSAAPSSPELDRLLADPAAVWLRMATDLLRPETLEATLAAPGPATRAHPDYSRLFSEDIGLALPADLLESVLRFVEENVDELDVCELETSTSGLATQIAGRVGIRRYVATDSSANFLANLPQDGLVEVNHWDLASPTPKDLANSFNLVLASHINPAALSRVEPVLTAGGFLLAYQWTGPQAGLFWGSEYATGAWPAAAAASGLELVQCTTIGDATAYLVRKPVPDLRHKVIPVMAADLSFALADRLQQESNASDWDRLWLVGANPGLPGLVRCLRREPRLAGIRCIVAEEVPGADWPRLHAIDALVSAAQNGVLGSHFAGRPLRPRPVQADSRVMAVFAKPGDLSAVEWRAVPLGSGPEIECRIHYSSLNFKDVMLATGKLTSDAVTLGATKSAIGFEFSGLAGERRVMGFGKQTFATHVRTDPHLLFDVPQHWSLQEAATVPTVYATVYYSLFVRAGFQGAGQSILVHAGAGGVGQAAIRVALSRGAQVFTTCSAGKVATLQRLFPSLPRENIASSRTTEFETVVLERTGGRGVDYVLNSLAGDFLLASLRCLKQHGHFLEIGKYDLMKNTKIGTAVFLRNASFHGIDVSQIFDANDGQWARTRALLTEGIARGEVRPLAVEEFPAGRLTDAFHHMGSGKHLGKVVVNLGDLSSLPAGTVFTDRFVPAPGTYVVVGGLGGVGLELCRWLVARGAQRLLITSTRGIQTVVQAQTLAELRTLAEVEVSLSNVVDAEQCRALFAGIEQLAGVFHLAMVLQDTLLQNMSAAQWAACVEAKAAAAYHLDLASRRPDCRHFVLFSSVSAGLGNMGQANYGFANSFVEGVCARRVAAGHAGLAVQWGAIGDVGYVASLAVRGKDLKITSGRIAPQPIDDCLAALEAWLVAGTNGLVSSYNQQRRGKAAAPASLLHRIASVLGLAPAALDASSTLAELGADSIQSIEIQSLVERAHNRPPIPVEKLTKMRLAEVLEPGTAGSGTEQPKAAV